MLIVLHHNSIPEMEEASGSYWAHGEEERERECGSGV